MNKKLVLALALMPASQQAGVYLISNNGQDVGDDYTSISNNLIVNDQNAYCVGGVCNDASGTIVLGGYAQGKNDASGVSSVDNGHCVTGTADNNFITLVIPDDIALFDSSYQSQAETYLPQGSSFPLSSTATPQVSQLCYNMAAYLIENFSSYDPCVAAYLRSGSSSDCQSPCTYNNNICGIPTGTSYPKAPVIGEYINPSGTSYCTIGFPTATDFKLRINTNFLTNTTKGLTVNTNYMPTDGQSLAAALQSPLVSFTDPNLTQPVNCTLIPDSNAGYASTLTVSDLVTAYTWFLSYVNWINAVYLPGTQNQNGYPGQCPFDSTAPATAVSCTNTMPQNVQTAFPAFATAYAKFITALSSYITNPVTAPTPPVPTLDPSPTATVAQNTAAQLAMPATPPALMLVCSPASSQEELRESATQAETAQIEQFFNQVAGQLTPPLPPLFGDQTSLNTYLSQQISGAVAQQCPNISLGLQTLFTTCATTSSDFISCVTTDPSYISLLPMSDSSTDPLYANGVCLQNLDNNLASILLSYEQVLQNKAFVTDAQQAAQTFKQTIAADMQYSSCVGSFITDSNGFPVISYQCPTAGYVPAYGFKFFFECPPCPAGQTCSCQQSDGTYNAPLYIIMTNVPMNAIFQSPQLPATDPGTGMTNNTEDFSCGFCNAHETTSLFESANPFNALYQNASQALDGLTYNTSQADPVCCNGFVAQFSSATPASCVMGQSGYPNMLYTTNLTANPIGVGLSAGTAWLWQIGNRNVWGADPSAMGMPNPPSSISIAPLTLDSFTKPTTTVFSQWGLGTTTTTGGYEGVGGVWVDANNWATDFYVDSYFGNAMPAASAVSVGMSTSKDMSNPLAYIAFNGGPFDPSSINGTWSAGNYLESPQCHTPQCIGLNCTTGISQLQCAGQKCTAYNASYEQQTTGGCYDPNIN